MTQSTPQIPARGFWRFVPEFRSRWWSLLLLASLMANLLAAGVIVGHRFGLGGNERFMVSSAAQVVPRKFFAQLPAERRRELLGLIRQNMRDLRGHRDGSAPAVLALATKLEAEPFDAASFQQAMQDYATGADSLPVRSAAVVNELVARLTPEERKMLAQTIRDRATARGRKN
jgi:uncharacterized membrane protein